MNQPVAPTVPPVPTAVELTPEQIAAAEAAAAEKAAKDQIKQAEKEQKKVEAAAKKAAKQAEVEAKKLAKEEKKKADALAKEANKQPEQNGVRRPKPETKCGAAWALFDRMSNAKGSAVALAEALPVGEAEGQNLGNMKTEYALWRRFNGITGRIVPVKAEVQVAAGEVAGPTTTTLSQDNTVPQAPGAAVPPPPVAQ